jgi:L-asparaginase II
VTGLARAFAAVSTAPAGTAEHRVATALRRHPEWLGGTGRDVTRLVAGVEGLIAKDGAEGVYAAALPVGRSAALKIDDGAQRARPPVMVAALRALGVDEPVLDELAETVLLGGGEPVGSVRCVL